MNLLLFFVSLNICILINCDFSISLRLCRKYNNNKLNKYYNTNHTVINEILNRSYLHL